MTSQQTSCICLIQITRIGDLLQTETVAKSLKKSYPELKIHLVAIEQFATPILHRLKKTFDICHLIDGERLLSGQTLEGTQESLHTEIIEISKANIDVCINLSFSRQSSYLCSLIKAKHKMGPWYDQNNIINIEDKWSKHIYASVMGGTLNPYSLVDMYGSIIGTPILPQTTETQNRKKQIVVHPFASNDKKMFSLSKWIDIIYTILKQNSSWKIIIVGSEKEKLQAANILNSKIIHRVKDRIINMVGTAEIEEVEEIIKEASLFIGNDSMVGHLAASHGTQAITIALGPVRPIETAPYSENNIVLVPKSDCFPCQVTEKCELLPCHAKISYQTVTSVAQLIIDGNEISMDSLLKYSPAYNFDTVRIYITKFTNHQKLVLDEISSNNSDIDSVFRTLYRICWNFFFDETEEDISFPNIDSKTANGLQNYLTGLQHLYDLCEFGKKYSKFILEDISCTPPKVEQVKSHSANIDEIDKLQVTVKQTFPLLAPIVDYFQICKSNLPGETLVELTENTYLTFNDFETVISIMHELIEKILTKYDIHHNNNHNTKNSGANA